MTIVVITCLAFFSSPRSNLKRVTIPEGLRKEQIADLLAGQLDWSDDEKRAWVTTYTALKVDYLEGVYFPDTYLIPIDERPIDVAGRLQRRFDEMFSPYSQEALEQNIKWTTVVTLASLVQREAADNDDMPLIAGILWNRLNEDMKLDVDATVQYARDHINHYGEAPGAYQSVDYVIEGDWWKPIQITDKQIDSAFNTYTHSGLPPHPISNPGIESIEAVLNSEETDCLYYLHDADKNIHCTETYSEHQTNIEKYIR